MPGINGTIGDDTIISTGGNDVVTGGAGNDSIIDQWGDDTIDGGDGDDVIVDEGGNNVILGGAGNDRITISDTYPSPGSTIPDIARINVIDAGTGNDYVIVGGLPRTGSLTINLGEGDDILEFRRPYEGDEAITLGAGRDTLLLGYEFGNWLRQSFSVLIISDFEAGATGDIINLGEALRGYFSSPTALAAFDGINPFSNGVLTLVQDGADVLIQFDYDGSKGPDIAPRTVIRLENVSLASLTDENFAGFDIGGLTAPPETITGSSLNDLIIAPSIGSVIDAGAGNDEVIGGLRNDTINGDDGDDILDGGAGNDTINGGAGDDLITDSWGNDIINGGAGNDTINIFRPGIAGVDVRLHETVVINAGDGNDFVRFEVGRQNSARIDHRTAELIADLGAGDDVIEITAELRRLLPTGTITLGAGRDTLILGHYTSDPIVITDFVAGDAGDVLRLAQAVRIGSGWDLLENPFATGHLFLQQDGADTLVIFDYDGSGSATEHFTLLRLEGVDASTLTATNFYGYDPTGAASSYILPSGTSGDDYLIGTYADDIINGGAGDDRIEERFGGSDTIDGGDGNDFILVESGFAPRPFHHTITGGAGNDTVDFSVFESSGQPHSAEIDLGTGNDRVIFRALPSAGTVLTLGEGADIVELNIDLGSQSLGPLTITDFETGAGGDRLEWTLLAYSELGENAPDYSPFIDESARLVQDGADTILQIRQYGDLFATLVRFENVTASAFVAENLGFELGSDRIEGTADSETIDGTAGDDLISARAGDDVINGLGGNDRIFGEDGADIINGGDGDDIIFGGRGGDFIDGGAGADRIEDLLGLDEIMGGSGDDIISVTLDFTSLVVLGDDGIDFTDPGIGFVQAGDGADTVTITDAYIGGYDVGVPLYSVDLGAGDDLLITDGHFGFITLGEGRDTVRFVEGVDSYGSIITDFETGVDGDVFDIRGLMNFALDVASSQALNLLISGANPFELGAYRLEQNGADVQLLLSPSVSGAFPDYLVATFQNTQVTDFTAENFAGFDPHVTPRLPFYIDSSTNVDEGTSLTLTNGAPDEGGFRHVIYRTGGSASFVNSGTITTVVNEVGYGGPIGFQVGRSSDPGVDATFHNTATGRFIVENAFVVDQFSIASPTVTYGFYAPQQGVNFLNDGYFSVSASYGIAYGVFAGYDVFSGVDRSHVNNGTFNVSSAYAAVGLFLESYSSFENTGNITVFGDQIAYGLILNDFFGTEFTNSGEIVAATGLFSDNFSIGINIREPNQGRGNEIHLITNSGLISADIAIFVDDTNLNSPFVERIVNSGEIEGAVLLAGGDDELINTGGVINGVVLLEDGNDLYDGIGGIQNGDVRGGFGDDTYRIDSLAISIIEEEMQGFDTVETTITYTLGDHFEALTLIGENAIDGNGNDLRNFLTGNAAGNRLTGGLGNDVLDGGANVDTAIVSGLRSNYTVTQTATGVFEVTGADGTDTLTGIEFLQFDDETIRLLHGEGVSVDFSADPSTYMAGIRDFDGNDLGGISGWQFIGEADVNGDGDLDRILVNSEIGRFAEVNVEDDGLVYFDDHGWAGETRVVGIYIDPLVQSGEVVAGSDFDSQRRFQNDLEIANINRVLGADDYDGDGIQEVYFALTDGSAYLRALMHADGNIRYANYQSEEQVIEYLTANGYDQSLWGDWFGGGSGQNEGDKPSTNETTHDAPPEQVSFGRLALFDADFIAYPDVLEGNAQFIEVLG